MTNASTEARVEELERKLQAARTKASYYKGKSVGKTRPKGESPKAKAHRLAANKKFNDRKRAMAHVVATITANEADHSEAYKQAYIMSIDELRELVKGHEDAVEKQVKVLQERREARQHKQTVAAPKLTAAPKPAPKPKPEPKSIRAATLTPTPDTPAINSLDKDSVDKVQKIVIKRLGFEVTTAQAINHVLSRYLQNYG